MNYLKIYHQLVSSAQNRQGLEGYSERHHILPKSFGGSNESWNIAIFTAREHFIAHRLLMKIFPGNPKVYQALWRMVHGKKLFNYSSRTYQTVREGFAKDRSQAMLARYDRIGRLTPEERRQRIDANRVKTLQHYYEHRTLRLAQIKANTQRTRDKINARQRLRYHTDPAFRAKKLAT